MATVIDSMIRKQLIDRHQRLEETVTMFGENRELLRLLGEVDAALERMNKGTYGLCEACNEPIESDRLIADPLAQLCIDHLTSFQQRELQEDLELASRIQSGLLPKRGLHFDGWEVSYHYEAVGPVSGDYCDLVNGEDRSLYFILGDVSGKGVAASMLMAHLHAMFRALISVGLPLTQLVERASRVFCESTLPMHFATLVCGRASSSGEVEICNAGHLSPLLLHGDEVTRIEATGLPIGLFSNEQFSVKKVQLSLGDTFLLYTDGLSEAQDGSGVEYGSERLSRLMSERHLLTSQELIDACMKDLTTFQSGLPKSDDLTIMSIQRVR